jgi:hypothetical protein
MYNTFCAIFSVRKDKKLYQTPLVLYLKYLYIISTSICILKSKPQFDFKMQIFNFLIFRSKLWPSSNSRSPSLSIKLIIDTT